jgi:serine phosphatase RsbU (regulator of sigma subunit)/pSer/pThr/pTyr-binding forkhead associated (FHA) protein
MSAYIAPRLVITDALGRRTIPIERPVLTIGRRSECDVRVTGADVSRQHAEVVNRDGRIFLRDCGSKFGTFVNGEKIAERELKPGDTIGLGQTSDTNITFAVGESATAGEQLATSAATELRHMAALLEGLRALGSGKVLEEVLALVLDSAIEVTGAERGFIMLANNERQLELKLVRARGKMTLGGRTVETSRKIPEMVFATGEQRIVEDLLDGDLASAHAGTVALGIRHVLCAPLRLMRHVQGGEGEPLDRVIGVLYLDSRERGALTSPTVQAALDTLSAEAAIAIENARLYRDALDKAKIEQELKVAAGIQQSLLPPGSHSGTFFNASAACVPCRAVGGDFFDYVDFPSDRAGFILGDVSGKGSPAALLAAAVLGMFSAEATYHAGSASPITRVNAGLFRRAIAAKFLTAFYCILGRDGSLTYTNAGHNPPIVLSATGQIRRLETGGVVLGLFEGATFEEETVTLGPGDLLLVFSDGVTEAVNVSGEEFGDARLIASFQRRRGEPLQEMLEGLLADVKQFAGEATQNDDITMLLIQYDPPAA